MSKETKTTVPQARPLYTPVRANNYRENPLECLPQETVMQSYCSQWYRFSIDDKHYALRPRSTHFYPFPDSWPAPLADDDPLKSSLEAFIIGYWHPHGIPSDGASRHAQQVLVDELRGNQLGEFHPAAMLHRESRWVEPALLVRGVVEDRARELGSLLGQPCIIRVSRGIITLVSTKGSSLLGSQEYDLIPLEKAPCPMFVGYQAERLPEREGGPYVSRSMLVAGLWSAHYATAHQVLPCDICKKNPGAIPAQKKDANNPQWVPSSRYKYGFFTTWEDDRVVEPLKWNEPLVSEPLSESPHHPGSSS